jgi:hypothetical protein
MGDSLARYRFKSCPDYKKSFGNVKFLLLLCLMENTDYVKLAINKFNSDKTPNWDLSLRDFICDCYLRFAPAVYGNHICEKIRLDLKDRFFNLKEGYSYSEENMSFQYVSAKEERGDIMHNFIYYETKVSFLGQNRNGYCLRHLRVWQDFHAYLICFIDCDNNFEPHFYVISSADMNRFELSQQNGTRSANKNNENVEMSLTVTDFKKTMLDDYNHLDGNSFDDLFNFMVKNRNDKEIKNILDMKYNQKMSENGIALRTKYYYPYDISEIVRGNAFEDIYNEFMESYHNVAA